MCRQYVNVTPSVQSLHVSAVIIISMNVNVKVISESLKKLHELHRLTIIK